MPCDGKKRWELNHFFFFYFAKSFEQAICFLLFLFHVKKKPSLKFRGKKEAAFHSPVNFCRILVLIHSPYCQPLARHPFPHRFFCIPGSGLCRGVDSCSFHLELSDFIQKRFFENSEKEQPSVLREYQTGFYSRKRFCTLFCMLTQAFCFSFIKYSRCRQDIKIPSAIIYPVRKLNFNGEGLTSSTLWGNLGTWSGFVNSNPKLWHCITTHRALHRLFWNPRRWWTSCDNT